MENLVYKLQEGQGGWSPPRGRQVGKPENRWVELERTDRLGLRAVNTAVFRFTFKMLFLYAASSGGRKVSRERLGSK